MLVGHESDFSPLGGTDCRIECYVLLSALKAINRVDVDHRGDMLPKGIRKHLPNQPDLCTVRCDDCDSRLTLQFRIVNNQLSIEMHNDLGLSFVDD